MSREITSEFRDNPNIKRFIPDEEVRKHATYFELADLAEIFNHGIVEMMDGVWRWQPSEVICWFKERDPDHNIFDFNGLWTKANRFYSSDMMKFYMNIGYSLSGFLEMFASCDPNQFLYDKNFPPQKDELLIDYYLRAYKKDLLII